MAAWRTTTQAPRHARPSCWRRATATCSSTGWPTCRCGHSPRRSARARACCSTSSTARTASSAPCWHVLAPTSCTSSPASARGPDTGHRRAVATVAERVWSWVAAPEHRALLTLWVEGYARSLIDPHGPWHDFARTTVEDWLAVLRDAQPAAERDTRRGRRDAPRCWPSCVAPSSTCSRPATSNGPPAPSATISQRPRSCRMPSHCPGRSRRPQGGMRTTVRFQNR